MRPTVIAPVRAASERFATLSQLSPSFSLPWCSLASNVARVFYEMLIVTTISSGCAGAIAAVYGWGTPFANRTDRFSLDGIATWMVACCTLVGLAVVVPLASFLLRGQIVRPRAGHELDTACLPQDLSMWQATVITLRLTWLLQFACTAIAVVITVLFLCAGVPLVRYNMHSLVTSVVVLVGAVLMVSSVASFRYRHTVNPRALVPKSPVAVHPVQVAPPSQPVRAPPAQSTSAPKRRSRKWRSLVNAFRVSIPSSLTACVAIQYITLARHINFGSFTTLILFSGGSCLLKIILPLLAKLFILRHRVRNLRNTFFMLTGPIMHVEIQIRMALLRAQSSTPIYVSSAFINILEIVARAFMTLIDLLLVRRAKQRVDKKREQLHAQPGSEAAAQELEAEFMRWRNAHLRVCATEILSEMAAEYCSIGLVAIFVAILEGNRSIELPHHVLDQSRSFIARHTVPLATQMTFELMTDCVAMAIEMRAGIPLVETLVEDTGQFMRWVIPVLVVHSSGLCISSLVVYKADGD